MEKLTPREEEIMRVLWQLQKAFVHDIIEKLSDVPLPHYNTISTLVRKMEEKGYVGHISFGKSHQYYPLVSAEQYKTGYVQNAVHHFFGNSYKNLVSFFAEKEKISAKELQEIIDILKNKTS